MSTGSNVTKESIQRATELDGTTDLAIAKTDHTTLVNRTCEAGVLYRTSEASRSSKAAPEAGLGLGIEGLDAIERLTEQQRMFVRELKRRSVVLPNGGWILAGHVFDACAAMRPALFDIRGQMRAKVTRPLEVAGWIEFDHTSPDHAPAA
jgi:hypothetical protein